MKTSLSELLNSNHTIVADGAMGTMLFALGLKNGESPELWNIEQADKVRSVHHAYIEAGSQIVLSNTFGCNRIRLARHHLEDRTVELNAAGARNARAEADAAAHPVVIAGSIGPTGVMLAPYGDLEFDEAVDIFAEQAQALIEGGVDVLWIETMSALEEVSAAIEGCRRVVPTFPIVTTMTYDTKGRTMMGVTPEKAIQTLDTLQVVALGANCGNGPDEIEAVIQKMHTKSPSEVLVAKANAGLPRMTDTGPVYDATPETMAHYALRVRDLGARIIGTCCGSNPQHIRAIVHALNTVSP